MSNNFNFGSPLYGNDKPPLPAKNICISGPPLPPKLNKFREESQKECKIKRPSRTKTASKNLVINNSSYALSTNDNNTMVVKEEKSSDKKLVYENNEFNIIEAPPHVKKSSLINKMTKLFRKSKRNSTSMTDEDSTTKSSIIVDYHKDREMCEEQYKANCSNVSFCTNCTSCCRTCHCIFHYHHLHHHHHHHIRCLNTLLDHANPHLSSISSPCRCHGLLGLSASNCHNAHYESSSHCQKSCSVFSMDKSCESPTFPIIPNRIRKKSSSDNNPPSQQYQQQQQQPHTDEPEPKSFQPTKPSPMEKYSINFLNKNLLDLKKVGWYWGSVSSTEAERVMTNRPDGTFLVRDSAHTEHLFSVTFRVNRLTYHARIQFSQNRFWWNHNNQDDGFGSIIDLIENSLDISRKGEYRYFENTENTNVPPYAVSLLNPLSRFNVMSSLKHLTRFVIISNVRSDHLEWLPLPQYLLLYLYDKEHHYIENFDRYVNTIDNTEPQPPE